MIKWYETPESETISGWRKWKEKTKKEHPIQYFFREDLVSEIRSVGYMFSRYKWNIIHRIHPKHRYNVVKLSQLKPDYYCGDTRVLHACFEVLVTHGEELVGDGYKGTRWTEEELVSSGDDYDTFFKQQVEDEATVVALRHWWLVDRPKREAELEKVELEEMPAPPEGATEFMWMLMEEYHDTPEYERSRKHFDKIHKLEEEHYKEDTTKLIELINVRHRLW